MIVCQKCGTENQNDAKFCANPSCQSFLEWEGEAVQTTQQPAIGPGGPGAGAGAGAGAAAPTRPSRAAGDGEATQPGGLDPEELLAKPSAAPPRRPRNPGQPSAVKPAEAKARPPEARRPGGASGPAGDGPPALKPGQSACPNCGWPIEAGWNFCHHCSTSLSLPKVGAGAPADRPSRSYSAGERPLRTGGGRAVRVLVALVSAAALIGVGLAASRFLPSDKATSTAATTTTSTTEPRGLVALSGVKMVGVETQSGSHVGALAVDGKLDTFWSRASDGDSTPHLIVDFGRRVKLARVEIASGASGDEFAKRARPKSFRVVFDDDFQLTFTLKDQQEVQAIDFEPHATKRFRVVVQNTYPGGDPPPNGERTSIRELTFFAQEQEQG
jgi:hypothetical protein